MANLSSVLEQAAADHVKRRAQYVWLVPDLPKGPTGKILCHEVQPPEDSR